MLVIPVLDWVRVDGHEFRYVYYSPTLSQLFPKPVWQYIMEVYKEQRAEIFLPIWSYYRRKGSGVGFSVVGPFRIDVESPKMAGMYEVVLTWEDVSFAGVLCYAGIREKRVSVSSLPDDLKRALKEAPKVAVRVSRVIDAPETFEYVSLNGKTYEVVHLIGGYVGRIIDGPKPASDIAVVITDKVLSEGEVVWGHIFYAKAGRADFGKSKYSHQISVVVQL